MNILGGWFELENSFRLLVSADTIPADLKAAAESIIKEMSLANLLVNLPAPTTPPVLKELILRDDRVYSILLYSSLWLADILPGLNTEQLLSLSCADFAPRWVSKAAEKRFTAITSSSAGISTRRRKHRKSEN
ncbi:MAG: hypothetical protein LBJ25_05385 [Candidatus Margulisbacteria bacterium]|jgi:hypothetical protein|nr:hypothetical protein [Candidatus Margulisiibacteriota bacterium]